METKDFTIGVLSITAVVLLAALLVISTRPEPAWASGMTASGGDYLLTVGRDASEDEELLYIVDSIAQRLAVYRFNAARQQIQLVQGMELTDLREAAKQPGQSRKKGRRSSRRRP